MILYLMIMKKRVLAQGLGFSLLLSLVALAAGNNVHRVIDGDTLVAQDRGKEETVRLLRINAPERGETGYEEAKQFLTRLVTDRQVKLEFEGDERDAHHRLLAYVFLEGKNINLEMVRAGLARFDKSNGEGKYADQFRAAEEAAQAAKLGIWKQPTTADPYRDWFCSSRSSSIYHPCSCPSVKVIEPANIVRYRTEQEAQQDRKVHCKCAKLFNSSPAPLEKTKVPQMTEAQVRQFLDYLDAEIARLEQEKSTYLKEGKTDLAAQADRELKVFFQIKVKYQALLDPAK